MNHQETYEAICKANTDLIKAMYYVIDKTEVWEQLRDIGSILKSISESEHNHVINEIQTQPIAEWKP